MHNKAAHNYALALSQIQGLDLKQAEEDLHAVRDVLRSDKTFTVFMQSPKLSRVKKKAAFEKVFQGKIQKGALHMFLVLIGKGKISLTEDIFQAYREILDKILGRTYVEVTVAKQLGDGVAIDEKLKSTMISSIESNRKAFGLDLKKPLQYEINVKVKEELLAGIRVRIGDSIFDGTVARNLIHWHDTAAAHPIDAAKVFS